MRNLGERDVIIVGGGLVGIATGFGMAREGANVLILDAGDDAFRASRGNFGLVWSQSKGAKTRQYAEWTRGALEDWPALQNEIRQFSGIDTQLRVGVGLHLCLGEEEFRQRASLIEKVAAHDLPGPQPRMIDREESLRFLPDLGEEVSGASYSSLDGDCHSLSLYRGLIESFVAAGGELIGNAPVQSVTAKSGGYDVHAPGLVAHAPKVLLAAGLATNGLAAPLGFVPFVRPQRGQILVTDRCRPFLPVVTSGLRQLPEGTVLIGDTKEEVGHDDRSTANAITDLARRAVRLFPYLASLRIVRSWGALRVLTLDGDPVYDESPSHPGIYAATTHSGVTLAPAHRRGLARWILYGQKPREFTAFKAERFKKTNPTGAIQ